MRLFIPAYITCLHFAGSDSPHALRFGALGILCGFLALAFALRRLTRKDVTA